MLLMITDWVVPGTPKTCAGNVTLGGCTEMAGDAPRPEMEMLFVGIGAFEVTVMPALTGPGAIGVKLVVTVQDAPGLTVPRQFVSEATLNSGLELCRFVMLSGAFPQLAMVNEPSAETPTGAVAESVPEKQIPGPATVGSIRAA